MSAVTDKLFDQTFKAVIPYATPWRIIATLATLLIGPTLGSSGGGLLSRIDSLTAKTAYDGTIQVLVTMPLWKLGFTIMLVAIGIPHLCSFFLRLSIKHIHIGKSRTAIQELVRLKQTKSRKTIAIYRKRLQELHKNYVFAQKEILRLRFITELSLYAIIISGYAFAHFHHWWMSIILCALFPVLLLYTGRKITIIYVTKAATFLVVRSRLHGQ